MCIYKLYKYLIGTIVTAFVSTDVLYCCGCQLLSKVCVHELLFILESPVQKQNNMIWVLLQENLYLFYVSNKDADQPAHPCSLISTFVIRSVESIKSKLVKCEISIF